MAVYVSQLGDIKSEIQINEGGDLVIVPIALRQRHIDNSIKWSCTDDPMCRAILEVVKVGYTVHLSSNFMLSYDGRTVFYARINEQLQNLMRISLHRELKLMPCKFSMFLPQSALRLSTVFSKA